MSLPDLNGPWRLDNGHLRDKDGAPGGVCGMERPGAGCLLPFLDIIPIFELA